MSDFEDEMDVDAVAPSKDVIFSSEATKGKRSTANLPVEAEDSLPWLVAQARTSGSAEGSLPLMHHLSGSKNTDPPHWTTSRATKTSLPQSTSSSTRTDSLTYCCMVPREREKRQQSWPSPVESMAPPTCARWCLSSMPPMTEASTWSASKSRHSPAPNKFSQ